MAGRKCETRPGGQPDGSSHMALGWMGARAKYSLRGGNYRSHIVRSHKTSATFKASERFFWIRRPLHSASAYLTQSGALMRKLLYASGYRFAQKSASKQESEIRLNQSRQSLTSTAGVNVVIGLFDRIFFAETARQRHPPAGAPELAVFRRPCGWDGNPRRDPSSKPSRETRACPGARRCQTLSKVCHSALHRSKRTISPSRAPRASPGFR